MSLDPLSAAFDLGKTAIERIWPDPVKRAEEMRKLEEIRQQGDLAQLNAHVQLMLGQIGINTVEAQHKSLFVAGWRPGIGWVGVVSLACLYIPKALVMTAAWSYQTYLLFSNFDPSTGAAFPAMPAFPDLGVTDLIGLLMSMLGVGIMRSIDKANKVQTDRIG